MALAHWAQVRPWSMGPGLGPGPALVHGPVALAHWARVWPWSMGPGPLAGWLASQKKSLNFFLERNRKFLRNFLMGLGSDTHVRIRKFLGNFLMGNLEIMKSALPARIFSACG